MKKSNRQITISENELVSLIETIVNRKIKKVLNEHRLRNSDDSDLNNSESEEKYDDNIYDFENFIINTSDKHDSDYLDFSDDSNSYSDNTSEDDDDSDYLDWSDNTSEEDDDYSDDTDDSDYLEDDDFYYSDSDSEN